ncbi:MULTISPECIES: hypothetical protein [unclassified Streptomyces]|uniref:hypothetical protein n=1 Tax=unclassified Streptomyces TaxID=2593676 RepID=UPI000851D5E2|nr:MULTISPECIES: hypothetical protein [unclassified Streptomyces]MDQ0701034.1 hypothetical protein [Streptomyces sp. W4I9-2]MDX3488263.1 hypothetical protein [Streptomyces sp. ID05-18]
MAVSISAVALLGIVVFVLIRGGTVRLGPALACAAFGFFLASTGAAPLITGAISGVTGWIASI